MRLDTIHSLIIVAMVALATQITRWTPFLLFSGDKKLPKVVEDLGRLLPPAMMGLLVENRYDGVLKRQQGTLHSTKHDGMGIGLVSIQTAVSRYGGSMTVETENGLFRVNILLNL